MIEHTSDYEVAAYLLAAGLVLWVINHFVNRAMGRRVELNPEALTKGD